MLLISIVTSSNEKINQQVMRLEYSFQHLIYLSHYYYYYCCIGPPCIHIASPANGTVASHNVSFGSSATYSCNTGFNITATAVRFCTIPCFNDTCTLIGPIPTCQGRIALKSTCDPSIVVRQPLYLIFDMLNLSGYCFRVCLSVNW